MTEQQRIEEAFKELDKNIAEMTSRLIESVARIAVLEAENKALKARPARKVAVA